MVKTRECYICGFNLNYINFIITIHLSGKREMFTSELMWEIWSNPIFILECCSCHTRKKWEGDYESK